MSLFRKLRGKRKGAKTSSDPAPIPSDVDAPGTPEIPKITPAPVPVTLDVEPRELAPPASASPDVDNKDGTAAQTSLDIKPEEHLDEKPPPYSSPQPDATDSLEANPVVPASTLRQRFTAQPVEESPVNHDQAKDPPEVPPPLHPEPKTKRSWLLLALTSGAFAAFNGAFAKLTTTSLTSRLTHTLAETLSIAPDPLDPRYQTLDYSIRGLFFALNILGNGIMWGLYTHALTAHDSATQVSILNTSANFLVTAVLGVAVFGERLGGLWFLGAAFLVLGNVIIGRKGDEGEGLGGEEGAQVGGSEAVDSKDQVRGAHDSSNEARVKATMEGTKL